MKNYKDFEKRFIGESDIASLTVRSVDKVTTLNFGGDGAYRAYIVKGDAQIGAHYELVFAGEKWVRIYDDFGKSFEAYADMIKIYKAGNFGCIIQLLNKQDNNNDIYVSVGRKYDNNEIEIISNGDKFYALYGWNGEKFYDCFEVEDKYGIATDNDEKFCFKPIYKEIDEDQYEIIGYEECDKQKETIMIMKIMSD